MTDRPEDEWSQYLIDCMADIRGDYERYQKMLCEITFSEDDTLSVIGDAINRGARGADVVLDMMQQSNAGFLRGNHEQICLDDLTRHVVHRQMTAAR